MRRFRPIVRDSSKYCVLVAGIFLALSLASNAQEVKHAAGARRNKSGGVTAAHGTVAEGANGGKAAHGAGVATSGRGGAVRAHRSAAHGPTAGLPLAAHTFRGLELAERRDCTVNCNWKVYEKSCANSGILPRYSARDGPSLEKFTKMNCSHVSHRSGTMPIAERSKNSTPSISGVPMRRPSMV